MATDTKSKENEYEGAPWDQEEQEDNTNTQNNLPQSPASEHNTDDFNNDAEDDDLQSRTEEGKENVNRVNNSDTTAPSGAEEPSKPTEKPEKARSKSRQRSRSRPQSTQRQPSNSRPTPSRNASNMSSTENTNPETQTATAAPQRPQKSQPLPSVWEDKDDEKSQLVKRNRRRKPKQSSGYDTDKTEEMPLRERRQPPQQQIQQMPQQAPAKKNDPMKLRLDLNLEIEVELKARIHGDLTLALLS